MNREVHWVHSNSGLIKEIVFGWGGLSKERLLIKAMDHYVSLSTRRNLSRSGT